MPPVQAAFTHPGRRPSNQDAVLSTRLRDGRVLLALADGMGGHKAGEIASALALDALAEQLAAGATLPAAMEAANHRVYSEANARTERSGMGTTLVAVLQSGNSYLVANVGDSRAYHVERSGIRQLTLDHSFVAEAVGSGSMTPEQAAASPWRNALTRAVGTDPSIEVDVYGPFATEAPHVVLLCSDGLHKALPAASIHDYVLATEDVGSAVRSLAALAYRRGSDDNISAAAVEFGSLERRTPEVTMPVSITRQMEAAGAGPSPQPRD